MSELRRPERWWAAFDFPRHPLAREDGERVRGCFVQPPARRLVAHTPHALRAVLREAHEAAQAGAWVLGGVVYEAAHALDAALPGGRGASSAGGKGAGPDGAASPLAEFAVWYEPPAPWPAAGFLQPHAVSPWRDTQDETAETAQIERIRDYIRDGDCYQVNLTTRLHAEGGPDLSLDDYFLSLHAAQPNGFALLLQLDSGETVASVSPELFFDWRPLPEDPAATSTWLLSTQPMKGTAPRGRDRAADEAAQAYLRTSAKERAENLMIVDLLRNDLSRVAVTGSVRVPRLFELHALPTVWQMTSTVSAVSRAGLGLDDVFAALFPCGSVTGAPKRRAMEIIQALEPGERGWYTGALGLMQPGGVVTFNVPIRTVTARRLPEAGEAFSRVRPAAGAGARLDPAHGAGPVPAAATGTAPAAAAGPAPAAAAGPGPAAAAGPGPAAATGPGPAAASGPEPATASRPEPGAGAQAGAEPVPGPHAKVPAGPGWQLECGIGSAITLDAAPAAELLEWRAKSRFLLRAQAPVAALETLRLEEGVFQREPRHLARLARTLRHFGLHAPMEQVRDRLAAIAAAHATGLWRVRITVGRAGAWTQDVQPLVHDTSAVWVALAGEPVDTHGPDAEFLQHKTTRRAVYDAALAHKPAQCFDVLLHNRAGELTEGCLTNLAVQLDGPDGPWLTPHLDAGLLPGTMREELLELGRIREARLLVSDLRRADALAVFNSVRGWREARLLPQDLS